MTPETNTTRSQKTGLVWLRDDLRIADNPALLNAAKNHKQVLVVYIVDEESDGIRPLGAAQKWFLHHALTNLADSLQKEGGRLDVFRGKSDTVIHTLIKQHDVGGVYWNRRCGKAEIEMDTAIKKSLQDQQIDAKSFKANLLHEPYALKTGSGGPYKVYSPFWRAMIGEGEPRTALPSPDSLDCPDKPNGTIEIDDLAYLPTNPDWASEWLDLWQPSESGAAELLSDFLEDNIEKYKEGRDFPAKQYTSRLSPYLRFGVISPYQIWQATRHEEAAGNVSSGNAEKFLKELAWREFSYHLLFHFPDIGWKNFQEKFDNFPWRDPYADEDTASALDAWQNGKTGYPIVDAGMRELWQTGYMHNRVRMIVGSFLVKHLLIHWHEGEKWFWDTLLDGDPANNTASWQWIAGSGADAAPYFRVFNPILQGKKFDGNGEYVRKYVPEISGLRDKFLHAPWEAPKDVLEQSGITLGKTYPRPIIEHARGRERALEAFQALTKAD